MSKVVVLSSRQRVILNELLNRVQPCATHCDASYDEYDKLRVILSDISPMTHKHVERDLAVRFIANVAEVGCDRPMALFEGPCGDTFVRAADAFTERFKPVS